MLRRSSKQGHGFIHATNDMSAVFANQTRDRALKHHCETGLIFYIPPYYAHGRNFCHYLYIKTCFVGNS